MKKGLEILLGVLLLIICTACFSSKLTDDAIIVNFLALTKNAGNTINWWMGIADEGCLDEYVLLRDEEPYEAIYYPLDKLCSIKQLEEETEKIFSRSFAQSNLYIVNTDPMTARFVEHEGKVYVNIEQGGWGLPYEGFENIIVKSKSQSSAVISVTSFNAANQEYVQFDFYIVMENGGWRLGSFFDF